jgi:hypothetical protein
MKNTAIGLACLAVSIGSAASAQEFVGGDITLGYSGFTERVPTTGGLERPSEIFLAFSGEIGMTRAFSIQGDLGIHNFNVASDTAVNLGVHAIFHASDVASFGAFVGHEEFLGSSSNYYGIEGGFEAGTFSAEAYYSRVDEGSIDADLYGLSADFDLSSQFGIGVGIDRLADNGPIDVSRYALSTDYQLDPATRIYAEVGAVEVDGAFFGLGSASESFFGVGIEYNLGGSRGATFQRRGLADLLPGL